MSEPVHYDDGVRFGTASEMIAEIKRLRVALQEREWKTIATAPKDGTPVLLCDERTESMRWAVWALNPEHAKYLPEQDFLGWRDGTLEARGSIVGVMATHWQPLPAPPQRSGDRPVPPQ